MTKEQFDEKLNELFIRFNTSPKLYQKQDYYILLELIKELGNQVYSDIIK